MNIFITGIAGGLGCYLTHRLLLNGHSICGNDIRSPEDARANGLVSVQYLWKATESLTRQDIEGCDILINLSATGDRPMGLTSPQFTVRNNMVSTAYLLEVCRGVSLQKFIQLGSGTSYLGIDEDTLPARENTLPKPTNPYSASKYAQDVLCMSYHYAYGLPVVIVRSGITYGAGRLAIAPHRFIINALQDKTIFVKGGDQTRTPTHISDIAGYVEKVIEAAPGVCVGKIINAVYPTSPKIKGEYSLYEMAQIVIAVLGSQSKIELLDYEPGERIGKRPLREWIISTMAEKIGMKPQIDFVSGIPLAADWILREMHAEHLATAA